jgi:hypothetical protein
MRISPVYAPDGMAVGGARAAYATDEKVDLRQRMGIVLAHERNDDGLVHNHNWASSAAPVAKTAAPVPAATLRTLMDVVLPQDRHDDGLVHHHTWHHTRAVSGR